MRGYKYNEIEQGYINIIRYILLWATFTFSLISDLGVYRQLKNNQDYTIAFSFVALSLYWIGLLFFIRKSKKI